MDCRAGCDALGEVCHTLLVGIDSISAPQKRLGYLQAGAELPPREDVKSYRERSDRYALKPMLLPQAYDVIPPLRSYLPGI